MNAAYLERQISGNQWPQAVPIMLHQTRRETTPLLPEPKDGAAILDDLEKQMETFEAARDATLNELRKSFVMPGDPSVVTFLREHRTVPQILLEAANQLKACFGTEAVFHLRAPIDESGSRTLYAVAMWPGKLQDVRNALAKFDNDWWMARAGQAAGYLTFTYELV
jgi:hypothetical protein